MARVLPEKGAEHVLHVGVVGRRLHPLARGVAHHERYMAIRKGEDIQEVTAHFRLVQ